MKIKVPFIFSFFPISDFNVMIIKVCLFFLFFDIYFSVNTFFFTKNTIHQIYKDGGKYNFSFFFPQIFGSFVISYIINIIIKYFSLSERDIYEVMKMKKKEHDDLIIKIGNVKRCLIIKYIIFYILSFIFLIFFWYYLSAFCAVYKNTQIYIIINTFISFLISIFYVTIYNIIPCILRIISLKTKNSDKKCIYNSSKILQIF